VLQEVALENFIHDQNMAMFQRLLAEEPNMDQERRDMILRLLANEETKEQQSIQRNPGRAQNRGVLFNHET
jgi:hypothetical protein